MIFQDKDVKTAQAILADQEVTPNHVEHEFRIWKGKLPSCWRSEQASFNLMIRRNGSRFRYAAEFEGA